MPTFSIKTLGCKVNQYESNAFSTTLRALGFARASAGPADLLVINTCCITTTAMAKSRQAIRRMLREHPGAWVFLTGCYGDYDPQRLGDLLVQAGADPDRVALVGHHGRAGTALRALAGRILASGDAWATGREDPGASGKEGWMRAAANSLQAPASMAGMSTYSIAARRRQVKDEPPDPAGFGPIDRFAGHQRAFVKIQDGCDAFCSYCIVPYTRPRVHSRDESVILTECRDLLAAGHREIVLCGVFLGAYGRAGTRRDRWGPEPSALPGLLRRVAEIDGLWRVRLSSLEPGDLTDELLAVYRKSPTVAPHLHLPLQSGSDRILQQMNRQYTRGQFLRAVEMLGDRLDAPAVTADIIVGFPGETEDDFQQTLEVAQAAGLSRIHAFAFSPIAPTAAWQRRAEAPPPPVVKDRLARLGELENRLARTYRQQFVGRTVEVLVETPSHGQTRGRNSTRQGLTDRYLTVRFAPPPEADPATLTGRILPIHVQRVTEEGLAGQIQTDV